MSTADREHPQAAPLAGAAASAGPAASAAARAESMSLAEMLRIMDVATELRQGRELVEEQLEFEELRKRLREKLLATAKVTGEEVTPEEVDAAITAYHGRMHAYQDPPPSLETTLANLYVRRWAIGGWTGGLLVGGLMLWWLFLSPSGMLTVTGRTQREVERVATAIARHREAIASIARDPEVTAEVARLTSEADAFRKQGDLARLRSLEGTFTQLEKQLDQEYTVSVVATPGQRSGFERFYTDEDRQRHPGYYLIVEARPEGGQPIPRTVRSKETGREKSVTTWAEQVPKAVHDRLAQDKRSDGILNETTFAVKRRGYPAEVVTMPDADGQPLKRLGQITEW